VSVVLDKNSRSGVLHMERLFDPAVMIEVLRHFEAVEPEYQNRVLTEKDEKFLRIGASTDAFRFDPVWYDLWRKAPEGTVERFRPYTWIVYPVQIRHIHAGSHLVPWHQDIGYQVLLGKRAHRQVITCFVPLEERPSDCAGLEFAVGDFDTLPHEPFGDHGAALPGFTCDQSVRPQLSMGDALVFGDHAPHQTVVPEGGRVERRSFEFRLIDPADAIDGKDYFDLERRIFVRTDGTTRYHP